jgi:hypothetical protein
LETSDKRAQDPNGTAQNAKPTEWGKCLSSSHWRAQGFETLGTLQEHFRKNLVYGVRSTSVVINSIAMRILQP